MREREGERERERQRDRERQREILTWERCSILGIGYVL